MSNPTSYFQIIRKITVAFAGLFKNISIIKENPELNDEKIEDKRIIVPIEFGDKEKYTKRLLGDPDLNRQIQILLPRFSYEFKGLTYDSKRKLNDFNMSFAPNNNSDNSFFSQLSPVPYDFLYDLTLYTRNVEDGNQIIEYILPYFTPSFSIRINLIPEMNIIKNIPIMLDEVIPYFESNGDYKSETRILLWTFRFRVKGFIFGPIRDSKYILSANTDFYSTSNFPGSASCSDINVEKSFKLLSSGYGDFQIGELIYQGYNLEYATGTGIVSDWNNIDKIITIKNISGCFKNAQVITGVFSLASYMIYGAEYNAQTAFTIITTPNPPTANATNYNSANTVIIEY